MPAGVTGRRYLLVTAAAVVLIPILALLVSGWEASDEVQVTDTEDEEVEPCIGVDGNGDRHMLYIDQEAEGVRVLHTKVDAAGRTLAGPSQVGPTHPASFTGYDLSVDHLGRAHIVMAYAITEDDWVDVLYTRLAPDGSVDVPLRQVYTSPHHSYDPQLDTDRYGNAYVVFNDMGVREILWLKVGPTGSVVADPRVVSDVEVDPSSDVQYPRIAVNEEGASFVVWYQKDGRFSPWGIRFTSLSPRGEVLVDPVYVEQDMRMDQRELRVALDGLDRLHVVYNDQDDLNINTVGLYYCLVEHDGQTAVGRAEVSHDVNAEAHWCDVAASPEGTSYVVYMHRGGIPRESPSLSVRVRDGDTGRWGAEERVAEGSVATLYIDRHPDEEVYGVAYHRDNDIWMLTMSEEHINRPPVASLSASPTDPMVGQTVEFDGSQSRDPDPDDEVTAYHFDWGDGATSGWTGSPTVTHAYVASGTYTASLRVRDTSGTECLEPATVGIAVTSTPSNQPPVPGLEARPTNAAVGEAVTLDGSGSTDPDGRVEEYQFQFGDGTGTGWTTSSIAVHQYTGPGTFEATLRVRDDDGAISVEVARAQVTVEEVNEPPSASIVSIIPDPALMGDAVTFIGSGTDPDGRVVGYSWTSDLDGPLSEEATFTTTSLVEGVHTIALKVRDDDGAWSEPAVGSLDVRRNQQPVVEVLSFVRESLVGASVELRVRYTDADGEMPTLAIVRYGVPGSLDTAELEPADPEDTDCCDGKEYRIQVTFGEAGQNEYCFVFENDRNGQTTSQTVQVRVMAADEGRQFEIDPFLVLLLLLAVLGTSLLIWGRSRSGTAATR